MKLIDADRLNVAIEKLESDLEEEYSVPSYGALKSLIDEQPTVYPIFSARSGGKTVLREYCAIREILENYGLDSTDPIETLNFVLNQYQRVVADLTGGFFSKLSYEADVIIAKVCDRLTAEEDSTMPGLGPHAHHPRLCGCPSAGQFGCLGLGRRRQGSEPGHRLSGP